ncbi:hypothetical protein FHS78_000164 [Parvibaculum indicum]|uniref:GIY-YIG nuclease family protein n=1 Tax=Parvibaculum indicum TaxID=562969 RepID=UPI001420CD16|nr:GIY-YIG nuclease family protein [Parvibaculum indicum]NIJ39909.1 hypothetical protein [Parvibaculum indicum]
MKGYGEFELDIPSVMREQLPRFFSNLEIETLNLENIGKIPEGAQGAYLLFLRDELVYVGKTDAQAGFRNRLTRHFNSIQHRHNLLPKEVGFKATRIFVFSTFDIETMLIEEYSRHYELRPAWNFSGFGSNDPGHNRENQHPAQFDLDYPIDIDRPIEFLPPGQHTLVDVAKELKSYLPYLFRYEGARGEGHPDMQNLEIVIPAETVTMRDVLKLILDALPPSWQATVLPSRVILYRENRTYQAQAEILRREF